MKTAKENRKCELKSTIITAALKLISNTHLLCVLMLHVVFLLFAFLVRSENTILFIQLKNRYLFFSFTVDFILRTQGKCCLIVMIDYSSQTFHKYPFHSSDWQLCRFDRFWHSLFGYILNHFVPNYL